jgi:hypothetical protein
LNLNTIGILLLYSSKIEYIIDKVISKEASSAEDKTKCYHQTNNHCPVDILGKATTLLFTAVRLLFMTVRLLFITEIPQSLSPKSICLAKWILSVDGTLQLLFVLRGRLLLIAEK